MTLLRGQFILCLFIGDGVRLVDHRVANTAWQSCPVLRRFRYSVGMSAIPAFCADVDPAKAAAS
jgi:hypothetical protein